MWIPVLLALLLKTALELRGYAAQQCDTAEEIANINPALVILDVSDNKDLSELSICSKIKMKNSKIKIITTSIYHSKEQILNSGADVYLPKPYTIDSLTNWAEVAIKEYNE